MVKIMEWIQSRIRKPKAKYDKTKREFEMAIGKPFINIRVEIPKGFEDLRAQFLSLETDESFLEEVRDLIKKRLTYEKHSVKTE